MASRRGFLRLSRVLPTSRVFTSGYVNTETILHFLILVLTIKLHERFASEQESASLLQ